MKNTTPYIQIKLLAVLISFILLGCNKKSVDDVHMAFSISETMYQKCEFDTAQVKVVQNEIRLFGKLEADNNKVAEVHSAVSGVVKSINVGLGDYVKQGQILASVQSIEVASLQKEKLEAVNAVAVADKNLEVAISLFHGKLNTERDIAIAEKELENAKAELNRVNEVYNIYNLQGGSIFNILAPINGFVTTKKIITNELIRSDDDDALFTIADTKDIWVVAYVNESDISKIAEGQDVSTKTLAFPDSIYHSKIEKIYNVIDPTTKSIKIRANIDNDDFLLKPDMNCSVTVSYPEDKSMVAIPTSSIIFDKSKFWVMVFKNKQNIETRQVEIYRQLGETTYIKGGVDIGEVVISKNGLLIYDAIND